MDILNDIAYGGIIFDNNGLVLLRSPTNHWGGYVWTFAKGGFDPALGDVDKEQTALREVTEETGYECKILSKVPGLFESDTCLTQYYLMCPIKIVRPFDHETQEIRWVTIVEAFELINMTKTIKGRERDREALKAAIETHHAFLLLERNC